MGENLKNEEFVTLLKTMDDLCAKMPELILLNYFDSNEYLYDLYIEAFNSIKGFCVLLGNGALIIQAGTILRMALEQTATVRVLETHKKLMDEYKEHQKFRFEIRDKIWSDKTKVIKEHYKENIPKGDSPNDYLEYGWFRSVKPKYGLDALIELSRINEQDDSAIVGWKNIFNAIVHGSIKFSNIYGNIEGSTKITHELILFAAKLLDYLVADFHTETGFNFVISNKDYRKPFIDTYQIIFMDELKDDIKNKEEYKTYPIEKILHDMDEHPNKYLKYLTMKNPIAAILADWQ